MHHLQPKMCYMIRVAEWEYNYYHRHGYRHITLTKVKKLVKMRKELNHD